MGDQESVEMSRLWSPGTDAGARAGTVQVDRASRAGLVASAVGREMLLMRAPPEFGGLSPFADEAVDRPGIDELVRNLRHIRDLSVALGDVNDLDAESLRKLGPGLAAARHSRVDARILGDVEQGLLDQVRDQARIGSVREHGRGR